MRPFKLLLTLILGICSYNGSGQTYYQVTSTSGIQVVGGVIVTVVPLNMVTTLSVCGVAPYRTWVGGFRFLFSNHISSVRSHMMNVNIGDTIMLRFNGSQYNVSSSNLSYYSGTCSASAVSNSVIATNGYIAGTVSDTTGVQFDASPGYFIDSVDIYETSAQGAGAVFDFYFAPVCTNIFNVASDTTCVGGTLHLSSSGILGTNNTFSWTGPNNFSSSLQNPTRSGMQLSDTGIYYFTATVDTCTYHAAIDVYVKPNPVLPLITANHNPICISDTLLLSASSSPSCIYFWTGPGNFSNTSQNISIPNIIPADSGYYMVTANLNGCTTSDSIFISLKPLPAIPTATNTSPVCIGSTLNFAASSSTTGVTYYWTGPNNFNSSLQNPFINLVPQADSGYYKLTTFLNGCSTSDSTHVYLKPLAASVFVNSNSPVCQGDTLKIFSGSLSPGVIYAWSGPATFTSSLQNDFILNAGSAAAGNYYLNASLNGCSVYDTLSVIVNPLPALPLLSSNSPVCDSSNLMLGANSVTSGVLYSWTGPGMFAASTQNSTRSVFTVIDTGYYIATVSLNACQITDSIHVILKPRPATIYAGSNSPVCQGANLNLNAGSGSPGVTYLWSGPNNYSSSLQNPAISSVVLNDSGTYKVIIDLNGCKDTIATGVTVNPLLAPVVININVSPKDTVCLGDTVLFNSAVSNAGSPIYQWLKNGAVINGATNTIYSSNTINNGDAISCRVNSSLPCQSVNTVVSNLIQMSVLSYLPPTLSITAYPAYFGPGTFVTFTAHPSGNISNMIYQWRKNGIDIPGATSSTYTISTLSSTDTISLFIKTFVACTFPDTVLSNNLSPFLDVKNLEGKLAGVEIYPNPGQGIFTLKGLGNDLKAINITVLNMFGQIVVPNRVLINNGMPDMQIILNNIPQGLYILKIQNADNLKLLKLVVDEKP